jgi:hypothetical protein
MILKSIKTKRGFNLESKGEISYLPKNSSLSLSFPLFFCLCSYIRELFYVRRVSPSFTRDRKIQRVERDMAYQKENFGFLLASTGREVQRGGKEYFWFSFLPLLFAVGRNWGEGERVILQSFGLLNCEE